MLLVTTLQMRYAVTDYLQCVTNIWNKLQVGLMFPHIYGFHLFTSREAEHSIYSTSPLSPYKH